MDTQIAATETAVTAVHVHPVPLKPERLESVDLVRGVVMILMALDHVRDFWSNRLLMDPTDLNTTTAAIFLTRWVTHYCAPTFIFLAGTSAFLAGTRGKSTSALSWFLFTRGLWLAIFEVTINRALWMFNFDLQHHGAGVFWAIGWAMVLLAGLVYLPTAVVTLVGFALIVLHNLLDGVTAQLLGLPEWLWMLLHQPGDSPVLQAPGWIWDVIPSPGHVPGSDNVTFGTAYCLIPWMGAMAAGYGFGSLLQFQRLERRRLVFLLGAVVTLAFIVLRLEPLRRSASLANAVEPFLDLLIVPELHQVSCVTALFVDDARARAAGPGALRSAAWIPGPARCRLRPGAVFLLLVAHSADPRRGGAVRLPAVWLVAVGEQRSVVPPHGRPAELWREPLDRVSRLDRRFADPLLAVSLVRGRQAQAQRRVAQLLLTVSPQ